MNTELLEALKKAKIVFFVGLVLSAVGGGYFLLATNDLMLDQGELLATSLFSEGMVYGLAIYLSISIVVATFLGIVITFKQSKDESVFNFTGVTLAALLYGGYSLAEIPFSFNEGRSAGENFALFPSYIASFPFTIIAIVIAGFFMQLIFNWRTQHYMHMGK